jgi:two-component system osmolarity sensor histidine kinase EnvZ
MNLLPRSLFHRNLLLIVLLIVVSQIGNALIYRELVMKPRMRHTALATARNLEAAGRGLRALPEAQRAAFVAQFNARQAPSLQPLPAQAAQAASAPPLLAAATSSRHGLKPLERDFVDLVAQQLALQGGQLRWQRGPDGAVALSVDIDGDGHWLTMPGTVPTRQYSGSWLLASACGALLALLGAWLIQRRINQPLQALVQAAQALGRGERPAALPEDGPTEIATLAHGFNDMAAGLARNEDERMLMLAGLSHDLRTPLAKMRLATEMLQGQGDAELLDSLNRNVANLDELLTQFLDFARAANSASWHQEAPVQADLDALVREVLAQCPPNCDDLDAPPDVSFEPGHVPPLSLHPQAIRRMLLNLVVNAQRHGEAPIVVATGHDKQGIWLDVRDRGPGIPPDRIDALKAPFARGTASRSGAPGAGLGLAIVDRVAQAHGARFDLLPRLDGGLTARVHWPIKAPDGH